MSSIPLDIDCTSVWKRTYTAYVYVCVCESVSDSFRQNVRLLQKREQQELGSVRTSGRPIRFQSQNKTRRRCQTAVWEDKMIVRTPVKIFPAGPSRELWRESTSAGAEKLRK